MPLRAHRRQFLTGLGAAALVPGRALAQAARYPRFVPLTPAELFESAIRFRPGSPAVSIGLAEAQPLIEVSASWPLRLFFDELGMPKEHYVDGPVRLRPLSVQPGRRRHWVLVSRHLYGNQDQAEQRRRQLARRHTEARVFTLGTVMALQGNLLDTRVHRVGIGGTPSRAEAEALRAEYFRKTGESPSILAETEQRPSGRVEIEWGGRAVHRADGPVCVTTAEDVPLQWGTKGRYAGQLYAVPDHSKALTLVNSVSAERMLAGLIPAEMFASAPAEALKAQAVTARGAVFAKLGHRHLDTPFHLCSWEHCQVYAGVSKEDPRTTAAVDATRGLLAVRPGAEEGDPLELVASVYSSTCGGYSENNDVVWDQAPSQSLRARIDGPAGDPALEAFAGGLNETNIRAWLESYPPTYEAKSSFVRADKYRWTRELSAQRLVELGLGRVERIEVLGRGPGGRVTGVRLHTQEGTREILRELPVRRAFGNLNSGMFVVDHERAPDGTLEKVRFTGGGWGHGSGMCQIGAIGRAERGQSFKDILAHYYNGAVVKRVY